MSEIGTIIIYIIMAGALVGAIASVIRPESGLGKEFVNGIHSIGPVFLAQAGIMAAIPIISYAITNTIGPLFPVDGFRRIYRCIICYSGRYGGLSTCGCNCL